MSTAKPGLIAPFNPQDPPATKPARSRKQRSSASNNSSKKPDKNLGSSSTFSNGLNTLTNTTGASGHGVPNTAPNASPNASSASVELDSTAASIPPSNADRPRGYLSNRPSANRLDQDPPARRRSGGTNTSTSRQSSGRLFDPKKDPIPLMAPVLSSQQQQQSRSGPSDPRGFNSSSRERSGQQKQQQQRLYDPNQPQPQSVIRTVEPSSSSLPSPALGSASVSAAAPPGSLSKQSLTASQQGSAVDGIGKLTKEIQQLERKMLEKPSRRTLESDEEAESSSSRHAGQLTWTRRIDNSKRLASKYLKLLQLDFKSSLKYDIDTRCWKLAIYPLIESFRTVLRNSEHTDSSGTLSPSDSDDDHTADVRDFFAQFITFAQEFYENLKSNLQRLETKHATPNGGYAQTTMAPRWHRCIGILGDLARYRWLHKLNDDASPPTNWLIVARRYYREAIDLGPCNGKMYNQLALLAGCRGLESLYYYSKSLTVRTSFMNARDTLTSFFAANEQIRHLQSLELKPNSRSRQDASIGTTMEDCEGSFLILHAMLFAKINLDKFEKRLRTFSKQLRAVHIQYDPSNAVSKDTSDRSRPLLDQWSGFYFMLAVINIAAVYEFNWSASVIAKSDTAFGPLANHLTTVVTLPYSSKLLLSTMEQTMQRYLISVGDSQKKVISSTLEEQQGWLVYCHVVLVWMSGRPLGSGDHMMENWLTMADQDTLPSFWTTLVAFMNCQWKQLSPFEQSDMLSAMSEEMSDHVNIDTTLDAGLENIRYQLTLPPLGQEWELRGLAWLPRSRYTSRMFKGSQPVLDDAELKGGYCLWKKESLEPKRLTKRIVELSLIAALHMKIIEFDFCESAFKVCDEYMVRLEKSQLSTLNQKNRQGGVSNGTTTEEYSTDDNLMSSSHASISQDSGIDDDEPALFSSDGMDFSTAEIIELKSKRDQLKSLLTESNSKGKRVVKLGSMQREYRATQLSPSSAYGANGGNTGNGNAQAKKAKSRGYMDRRNPAMSEQHRSSQQRGAMVAENAFLVIDTNCLVADWTVIQRLVSLDRWTVIIPLAVITELDGLKNNPAPLGPAASAALNYLEGCMAMRPKPRRLKIQTSRGNYMNDLSFRVETFNYDRQQQPQQQQQASPHHRKSTSMSGSSAAPIQDDEDYYGDEEIMRKHNIDDFILGLCLWHQEQGLSSGSPASSPLMRQNNTASAGQGIYLVTDDRNLRVKARARNVDVLGKEDLHWMTGQQAR